MRQRKMNMQNTLKNGNLHNLCKSFIYSNDKSFGKFGFFLHTIFHRIESVNLILVLFLMFCRGVNKMKRIALKVSDGHSFTTLYRTQNQTLRRKEENDNNFCVHIVNDCWMRNEGWRCSSKIPLKPNKLKKLIPFYLMVEECIQKLKVCSVALKIFELPLLFTQ